MVKKEKKIKKFDDMPELSDEIESKDLEITPEELKAGKTDKFVIDSIIDVFTEPPGKIDENGMIAFNADLSNKDVKRGDIVYITALVKKAGSSYTSPSSHAIIKLRIIDIYHGLAYLNKFIG